MALSQYISDQVFQWLLEDINLEADPMKKQDILSRAVGGMESELSAKFIVPLVNRVSNTYAGSPAFAQQQILNCLKAKIRSVIGVDKNRNLAGNVDSDSKFINLHEEEYKQCMKVLLNYEIDFQFALQPQAKSSKEPVQHMGLSRNWTNKNTDRQNRGGGGNNSGGFGFP